MASETRRSVLDVRVLVETSGSADEHDRSVQWAASRIKTAHSQIKAGGVAVQVRDTTSGRNLGFAGHGQEMSPETKEIVDDLFDVSGTT